MRNKKQRGGKAGLTTSKAAIRPKSIVLSFSSYDVEHERLLPDTHIAAISDKILAKQWTPLFRDSPVIGPNTECFRTVLEAWRRFGGKLHTGWIVGRQPMSTSSSNSYFGYLEVTSHAVWEYEGQLFETIPQYSDEGMRFILDDAMPFGSQMGINFLDRVEDVRRCTFGGNVNILTRPIDLLRTPRLLLPPQDHATSKALLHMLDVFKDEEAATVKFVAA